MRMYENVSTYSSYFSLNVLDGENHIVIREIYAYKKYMCNFSSNTQLQHG